MSAPRRLNVTTISVASSQPSSTAKFMTGFLSDSFVDNKDENQFAVLSNVASEKTLIELEKENLELKNIIKNMENELRQAEHRASLAENRTNFILHETRNYIAPVVAVVDVLDGSASTEEYKEDIKILKSHIDDSGDFVSKQLDLAKIIANQAELKNEATKLYDLLQKIIIFYQLEATKKNITLSLEMKNKDIFVQVDPHALKMLLKNYISNAIKYTHQGKVTINVNAKKKNDYFDVEFKIIDTGIGMSKEAIKNLYQPFSQVHDKDQHPTIVGTGLGLFNAKKLIEKLHGKVSVVSKEGVGTTFTISFNFPAAKLEAANNLVVVPEKKRCLIM